MSEWMIDSKDPACQEIVSRAKGLGVGSNPDKAAHSVGKVTLADGRVVQAHVVHAVDAIITDGKSVIMIDRLHDPGKGKPAFPGGLLDPTEGGVETAVRAAAREAGEEAGADLQGAKAMLIGGRNMDRPQDVRIARGNGLEKKYGIKDGEIFMVSTQIVRFDVPDLSKLKLVAGDDALKGSARAVSIKSLSRGSVGISDHFDMLVQAFPNLFNKLGQKKQPRL
jgi:8-oxo-dGTP pyrophosphatase MutT (NUDIX family)